MQIVLACKDSCVLDHMLSYGKSIQVFSADENNTVTSEKMSAHKNFYINLHAAYLLRIVSTNNDLEKIKRVVSHALKKKINLASVPDNDHTYSRIDKAFALACQKGYIETVKEILKLKPRHSGTLPTVPTIYIEKCKKTRENERVSCFLSAHFYISTRWNRSLREFLTIVGLSNVHTDDLACLPSYFDLDFDLQEELESVIKTEMTKRKETEEKSSNSSSASRIDGDPSISMATTSITPRPLPSAPNLLESNSDFDPGHESSPVAPASKSATENVVSPNFDVSASSLASNPISNVAMDMQRSSSSSLRQALSFFPAPSAPSNTEVAIGNYFFMVKHGLELLDQMVTTNPDIAQVVEDQIQALFMNRNRIRNGH